MARCATSNREREETTDMKTDTLKVLIGSMVLLTIISNGRLWGLVPISIAVVAAVALLSNKISPR